MKKLFWLLFLYAILAWSLALADFGSSIDGEQASVTFVHTVALDSAWVVFGYDGDAGDADTANMYDSLKLLPTFSGDGKVLWADGLDLDSLGTHVVKIWGFTGDAIEVIHIGIWEHNDIKTAAACGSGIGIRTLTVTVKDTSDSSAISGFRVAVYDSSSGEFKGNKSTNSNGVVTFSLDDDTYTVHITKTPWSLATPRYFTITANMDSTFYASAFDAGNPASADMCRIYINDVRDMGAIEQEGCELRARVPKRYHPVTVGEAIRIPRLAVATSDASGYVYLDVYRSTGLTAGDGTSTVKYDLELLIDEDGDQVVRRRNVEIPDQAQWEIDWTE